MLANGTAAFQGRALTWDYVPWEQMTKQRRGIMWAMNLARSIDRTLDAVMAATLSELGVGDGDIQEVANIAESVRDDVLNR